MANVFEPTIDTSTQARATGYSKDRHVFYTSDHRIIITYQDGGGIYARMSADSGVTWTKLDGTAGETQITSDTGYEWSGFIDSNDIVHITFADSSNDIKYVALTRSSNTWNVGTIYTVNTGTDEFPSITVINSVIWVVWVEVGDNRDIKVKSSADGETWSDAVIVSTINNSNIKYPILVHDNNQPMVIYSDDTTHKIYTSLYNGSTWPTPIEVYDGTYHIAGEDISAATDKFGYIHLIWNEYSVNDWRGRIVYRKYDGSWQNSEIAISQVGGINNAPDDTNAVQIFYYPTISIDSAGEIYVTTSYYEQVANRYEIVIQVRGSTSWDMNEGYFLTSQDYKNIYLNTAAYGEKLIPFITTRGTASPYNIEYNFIPIGGVKQIDWINKNAGSYTITFNGQAGTIAKLGFIFKAKNSKTINKIRIYIYSVTGSPGTATLQLRSTTSDDARRPTSTVLTSGTFTPSSGWAVVDVTNYSITAGTYYAIIIIPGAGVDSTNYFKISDTEPQHFLASRGWAIVVGSTDPGDFTTLTDTSAIYLLEFDDVTYEGFPYIKGESDSVFGNDWWICQKWVQSGDIYIDGFSLYVIAKVGSPADNLDFDLLEDDTSVESGEICNTSVVETNASWYSVLFSTPRLLKNGSTYRLLIKSPNSINGSNCWLLAYPNNTGAAPYDTQSWGGIAELLGLSENQGSSWDDYDSMDVPFRLFYTSSINKTQTCSVKANINTGIVEKTQTIATKAKIEKQRTETINSKGNIQKQFNQTLNSKALIQISSIQSITSKGNIKGTLVKTFTSKGSIKISTERNVNAKARIQLSSNQSIQSKANIQNTNIQTISAKTRIQISSSKTINAKGRIEQQSEKAITAKSRIQITSNYTITAKGRISISEKTQTITTKANIICITIPILVTPEQFSTKTSPLYLIWEIPTCCKERNIHACVQVDKTDDTFGDLEKDLYSFRDSNFEYWDGGDWVTYPTTGVTSAYYGNQARVLVTLTPGTKYWRVRGGVK